MSSDLIGKLETDVEIKASATKYHHMFMKRPHHISNVSSDKVHACELHEGEWGTVGSIICWKYFHDGKSRVAKQVIEAVDEEKNIIIFKMLEGDLMEHFESFKLTVQATPKTEGEGCVVHWILEYQKKRGEIVDPHTLLQLLADVSKDLEEHLLEE